MVRRSSKKKKSRVSRQKGVSLISLAETYMLTGVLTKTMFNATPVEFFMGSPNAPSYGMVAGTNKVGIRELFSATQGATTNRFTGQMAGGKSTGLVIRENLEANAGTGIAGMILVPLGFKFGRKLAAPATRRINSLLAKAGVANTVKL